MLSWALQWQGGLVKGSSPASTDVSVLYDLRSDWLDLQAKCSCSKHVINHILSRTPSQPASKQSMLPISPGTSPLHTTWLNPLWRANSWRGYAPLINPNVYFLLIPSLLTELFLSPQVFVHGDELDGYIKEFDADILPADFDGKASVSDCKAIAAKLFGSEDTALWRNRATGFTFHITFLCPDFEIG